jgi:mediator of replication checkpoint protein 1
MSSHTESLRDPSRREEDLATAMDIDIRDEQLETIDSPQATRPAQASRTTNVLLQLIESDSEPGEEAPVQPRRKLISALKNQLSGASSDSEEDDNGAGAYERIKAQLMSGTSQQEAQKTSQHVPKATNISSSESEEEMPARANINRRLGARKEKNPSPQPSPSPSARSQRSSPGLFVTPNVSPVKKPASRPMPSATSDSDIPQSTHNADLDDRVKRIRAERKAKAQQSKVQEQEKRAKKASRHGTQESDSDPDGENGRRLTQQARPTRKASKKALEDISREQQRISRNMQLTHQAKTKKRYTTKDLMATFGYQMSEETTEVAQLPTPDPSSAPVSSDVEVNQIHDTPTSPPCGKDAGVIEDTTTVEELEMPLAEELVSSSGARLDKGKGRAIEFQHLPVNPLLAQAQLIIVRHAQVEPRKPASTEMVDLSDSDDEIEIVKSKSRFPVFDRLPQKDQQEAPSLLHLRHLAHLTRSDNVRKPKGAQNLMSVSELQFSLAQKARQQANKEREEKLDDMRRRGIHIETEEEREKQQMEIEDMVTQFEKQRQEDLKLSKLERGEAKKNGEILDDVMLSSDDDEDYVGSGEEDAGEDAVEMEEAEEEAELELSGSEDEDFNDEADDEDELDEEAASKSNGLNEEMADEDAEQEHEHVNEDEDMEEEALSAPLRNRTVNRARHIIVDDEDESDEAPTESTATQLLTQAASATQDNVMAAFGFNNPASSLGLTQVFAGTMANLESNSQDDHPIDKEPEQDSLDFLRNLPDTQPSFSQASDMLVPNSQALDSQQDLSHAGPVSQINLGISQLMEPSPTFAQTQMSEMPEPTQDVGFGLSRSPAGLVAPVSTIETVMMAVAESPVLKRKGKLHQRQHRVVTDESDVDEASESEADHDEGLAKAGNAFVVMTKAAKKKLAMDDFNKKTSWAKDAIEEQAEESEDEYAGIGGADGEDTDEDDEELNEMIDTSDVKVDERKMAAFYA